MQYQEESQEGRRGSLHIPSLASTHIKNPFIWASCPHSTNDANIQQELQRADRAWKKTVYLESLSQSSAYLNCTLKTTRTESSSTDPALGIYSKGSGDPLLSGRDMPFKHSQPHFHYLPSKLWCLSLGTLPRDCCSSWGYINTRYQNPPHEDICYLSAAILLQVSLLNVNDNWHLWLQNPDPRSKTKGELYHVSTPSLPQSSVCENIASSHGVLHVHSCLCMCTHVCGGVSLWRLEVNLGYHSTNAIYLVVFFGFFRGSSINPELANSTTLAIQKLSEIHLSLTPQHPL